MKYTESPNCWYTYYLLDPQQMTPVVQPAETENKMQQSQSNWCHNWVGSMFLEDMIQLSIKRWNIIIIGKVLAALFYFTITGER